ncbi:MAG: LUD domain-containing protein, partial [Planctomycetota bacterium]|nr:LUD domain-containing protein [Planctomycetota bacterium]
MATGREQILGSIRRHRLPNRPLPSLERDWIVYDDPVSQFTETLEAVGGKCIHAGPQDGVSEKLKTIDAYSNASKVLSTIPAVKGNVNLATIDDRHDLEDLDYVILAGEFGVAESAAIWLNDRYLRHRVAPFITQHLALTLSASEIVHNMHQAYERLSFENSGFGIFISGPSKTADIEQSLV